VPSSPRGGLPETRVVFLGLIAASAGFLSVFAANDLYDRHADLHEGTLARDASSQDEGFDLDVVAVRHPLAAGILSLPMGVAWVAGWEIIGLAAAYVLNPVCAGLFLVCNALEYLYCRLRYRSWLKAIPAGVMVGLGGLAGWLAVADISAGALTFFALLTVWEITGRNLSNDLADAKTDRHLGIATLATTHGPQTSIRWIFAGALVMPALAAIQPGGPLLRLSLAAAAIVLMTVPAWRLMRAQSVSLALPYFNRASLFPVIGLVAALLTPSLT